MTERNMLPIHTRIVSFRTTQVNLYMQHYRIVRMHNYSENYLSPSTVSIIGSGHVCNGLCQNAMKNKTNKKIKQIVYRCAGWDVLSSKECFRRCLFKLRID